MERRMRTRYINDETSSESASISQEEFPFIFYISAYSLWQNDSNMETDAQSRSKMKCKLQIKGAQTIKISKNDELQNERSLI